MVRDLNWENDIDCPKASVSDQGVCGIFLRDLTRARKWSRVLTRSGRRQGDRGHPGSKTTEGTPYTSAVFGNKDTTRFSPSGNAGCNHTLPLSKIVITGHYAAKFIGMGTLWQICKKLNIIIRLASSPWRDWSSKPRLTGGSCQWNKNLYPIYCLIKNYNLFFAPS